MELIDYGMKAKEAQYILSTTSSPVKNKLLSQLITQLTSSKNEIIAANKLDLSYAKENHLSSAMLDRLMLNEDRIDNMIQEVKKIIELTDPIGEIISENQLNSGLKLIKKRVPLGVIGVIYESRPNVTIDIASLCLKTGNCAILRGGKEAQHTNQILVNLIQKSLTELNLPIDAIQLITDYDRNKIVELLKLEDYVDMIIPRGGAALQELCKNESLIPVILGGIGVCHTFVDESADLDKSLSVIINAKTQRPSTCNSLETLLIHQEIVESFLPKLADKINQSTITVHCNKSLQEQLAHYGINAVELSEDDLQKEWLSTDLNICIVPDLDAAICHIRRYGTKHSECILTHSNDSATKFINGLDAAAIYVNASTRFTDGAQFGLGAEVAVSTQKLHARGPMGLEALTTYKWIGTGNYLSRS